MLNNTTLTHRHRTPPHPPATPQENIDGLRAHYQRSAFDTVMKRIKPWHSGPDPNLGRSRSRGDGDAALITAAGEALSEPGADPARRGADGDAAPPAEKPRKKNKARAVLEADLPANVKAAVSCFPPLFLSA